MTRPVTLPPTANLALMLEGTRSRVDIGDVSSYTLTDLKPGSGYVIDMAAFLPDGTKSPYSPRITVTTE